MIRLPNTIFANRLLSVLLSLWMLSGAVALRAQDKPLELPADPDSAWIGIRSSDKPPVPPVEWLEDAPTAADVARFHAASAARAMKLARLCEAFANQFPGDERVPAARNRRLIALELAARLGSAPAREQARALEKSLSPLPPDMAFMQSAAYAIYLSELLEYETSGVDLEVFETEVNTLAMAHPSEYETGRMQLQLARLLARTGRTEAAMKVASSLQGGAADEEFKTAAAALSGQLNRLGKPLELTFTNLDGQTVSLADYRGKVVLIDFWAMWCVPCLRALPHLKELHARHQPGGFEILGINFDGDPAAVKAFVKKQGLNWPQYPGAEPGENELGNPLGIQQWPTVWLVDRKGVLRDLYGGQDTDRKIMKLLGENF